MAFLTYTSTPVIGLGTVYAVAVNGTPVTGETYTVNSTLGILAQYTAQAGDTRTTIASALHALINSTYTSGVSSSNPEAFAFHLPLPNKVTSTPTTSPPPTNPPPTTSPPVLTSLGNTITYGLRYKCEFDPPDGGPFAFKPRYRLEIWQKNYSGAASNVKGGPSPVVHQWQTDDTRAPVRGSSLSINLKNGGSIPLKTFYSVEDNEFKVKFYWLEKVLLATRDNPLYEGFLVQDDCNEGMVDFVHDISLSSNDGLGLLKDVKLNEAIASYDYFNGGTEILMATAPHSLRIGIGLGRQVQAGDKIQIVGTAIDGVYTMVLFIENGLYLDITTVEPITTLGPTSTVINIFRSNLLEKVTLLSIIKRCLSATGLQLKTNIYCNLLEINHFNTSSFLDQTLVDAQTFLANGTDYKDCYTVLEDVLGRFNLSLFQAEGEWQIVRWDELRYYNNQIPGFSYDTDMKLIGPVTLDVPLVAEPNLPPAAVPTMYPTYQLFNKIFRGFKYDKETFNYKQPPQLLRNFNLQQLGSLVNTLITGTGTSMQTIKDYEMPWWTPGFTWTSGGSGLLTSSIKPLIRVITDYVNNEIGRFLLVKGNPVADDPSAVAAYKIEVNKQDVVKISFSFKTNNSQPGPGTIVFDFNLVTQLPLAPMGVNNRYLDDDGSWKSTRNFVHSYSSTDNLNEWQSVEITSDVIPFDGHLYIKLGQVSNVHQETLYKDIRIEYIPSVNESTKIKGHSHTSTQLTETKNNEDVEIGIDTSPRNSVVGTLFLPLMNGILQKLTTKWLRGHMVTGGGLPMERRNLGDITTTEILFWRRLSRTILEGSFIGLIHDSGHRHLSLLSVMRYNHGDHDKLTFTWGKLELDYQNNLVNNSPMWEQWEDGEVDADLIRDYLFKFLYETK